MTSNQTVASATSSAGTAGTASPVSSSGPGAALTSTFTSINTIIKPIDASQTLTLRNTTTITTTYPLSTSNVTRPSTSTSSLTSSVQSIATSKSSVPLSSSSTSSTATAAALTSTKGVSSGAAAGIGIGCAIIGGLIALAFGFFFFRKRNNASQSQHRSDPARSEPPSSNYPSDKETMVFGGSAAPAAQQQRLPSSGDLGLDDILPQEADDRTVRQKASTLFDQFELHIENFYHDVKVPITPAMEAELSRYSTPHLSDPLVALLNATNSPTTLIKHCLAYHVISLTSPTSTGGGGGGGATRSLLPSGIAEMVSAMNKGPGRKLTPDTSLAFSRWRQLTAYLRPDLFPLASSNGPSSTSSTTTDPAQTRAADDAAHAFTRTFAPWARPEHAERERAAHLAHIVHSAVGVAGWLFAQPAAFRFEWKAPVGADGKGGGKGVVVVVPGLVKVSDGRGRVLGGGSGQGIGIGIVSAVVRRI